MIEIKIIIRRIFTPRFLLLKLEGGDHFSKVEGSQFPPR